ncbi:unnamed protein product [Linum tenue]|uniref:F-box domain-containing protein n=1 Tax=Linum tenue TaxID=586396 RepID=A0AAV0JVT5_9ROSI|nr:unnamed protein product [Linum tenue]
MSTPNPNKKIRGDGEAEERQIEFDRLSSLPDHILHLVLSFLDCPKLSAQTSVLSRRWRSLWKRVPSLTLSTSCLTPSSFARYVEEVLSRRPEGRDVEEIVYLHFDFSLDKNLFDRVVNFAASHGCRHLNVCVPYDEVLEPELFVPLANSDLRILRLRRSTLKSGFGSCGLKMLTILDLDECLLPCDTGADLDPFVNFPCLENLILCNCFLEDRECGFKIFGPRLVKLLIYELDCSKLEIFAPTLTFFDYIDHLNSPRLYNLRLPSLDHADIFVHDKCLDERNMEEMRACYISLLQGLQNASILEINHGLFKLLCKNCELLEHQSCPFTRLKSLKVAVSRINCPYRLPYHVISYFLGGSSTGEQAYIEFG